MGRPSLHSRSLAALSVLILVALAAARESATPALEIVTVDGAKETVKVYNEEPVSFFARVEKDGTLLRGVRFILYDEGGTYDRREFVRAEVEDEPRWGRPPTSFELPLPDRPLPVGRYRLRAMKRGHDPDEIRVVFARFTYFDLEVQHDKTHYAAKFHLRLEDVTEKRRIVEVEVRIQTADGLLLDGRDVRLRRVAGRDTVLETVAPIRLSSRVEAYRTRKVDRSPIVLKVVPNADLVLVLDGVKFVYPVPLPLPVVKGRDEDDPTDGEQGRGGRGR